MPYDTIGYGSEAITMKKRSASNGKPILWKEINLSRMKGKYLLITAKKLEFSCDKNSMYIGISLITEKNNKDSNYEPSGVVVWCLCILDNQRYSTEWKWGR